MATSEPESRSEERIDVPTTQNEDWAASPTHRRQLPFGFETLVDLPGDGRVLFFTRSFRLIAYGALGFCLALYLEKLGLSDPEIGTVLSLTLLGDVVFSWLITRYADRGWGRRRSLVVSSLLMSLAGGVFGYAPFLGSRATGKFPWERQLGLGILTLAGIIGVISPSGNEVGPAMALEQSVLTDLVARKWNTPSTEPSLEDLQAATASRTRLFGWYQLVGYFSTAFGAWIAGWTVQFLRNEKGMSDLASLATVIWAYGGSGLLLAVFFLLLSSDIEYKPKPVEKKPHEEVPVEDDAYEGEPVDIPVEAVATAEPDAEASERIALVPKPPAPPAHPPMPAALARLTGRLSLLFAIDSFAGALITGTILAYWFDLRFKMPLSSLGAIISGSQIIAGLSTIVAPIVAERIGLVKTMVFTHLPSNLLAAALPFAPTPTAAAALLFARFSISQMDTVPRASFQAMIAPPEHRTAILGTFNVVRSLAGAGGPAVSGFLFGRALGDWAFYICGGLKVVYDLWLLMEFGSAG